MLNQLEKLAVFQDVNEETLRKMWALGRVVCYKKEAECFRAKEKNDRIHIMLEGKASIYNLTHIGNRKIIFFLGRGELLDDCITPGACTFVNCRFIEDSTVFELSKKILFKLMKDDVKLMWAMTQILERKIWRMGHQLKNTRGSIYLERKLAAKLWKLCRDFGIQTERGIQIDIPLSITELSDFLGAPRETTSRICKLLCEKQLIAMEQRKIYVISPDKLSQFYRHGEA